MTTELKPCPFCGSALVKHMLYDSWMHRDGVYNMCPLAGHQVAILEHWNTRTPDPRVKELAAKWRALAGVYDPKDFPATSSMKAQLQECAEQLEALNL
jgi:hypothetical protein